MGSITITCEPVVEFEFFNLPSVNTHYNKHYRPRSIDTNEWKHEAREKALDAMMWDGVQPINRVMVIVNFYPPYEEISDIHNIHIKPLLDGFTEAGLYPDDEWAFMPVVLYRWAGITEQVPREKKIRRTVLAMYELESYKIDGMFQTLPAGRVKTGKKKK